MSKFLGNRNSWKEVVTERGMWEKRKALLSVGHFASQREIMSQKLEMHPSKYCFLGSVPWLWTETHGGSV